MRRILCVTWMALLCVLVMSQTSVAQISFVPGPARTVSKGPTYMAAADFNGDGISDVAVSSTAVPRVTVLFSGTDGSFESLVALPVGRSLRGLVTGDFIGDKSQDIAVVDTKLNEVFVIPGLGNGTFGTSAIFTAGRSPIGVAAAKFGCPPPCSNLLGTDLVVANGVANTITQLFNQGGNKLTQAASVPAGPKASAVVAADFNSDGFDDVAVLDTGAAGADQVTLFLNNRSGSLGVVPPLNYTVGVNAVALMVVDVNNDGVPDLAVLNSGSVGTGISLSVLLSRVTTPSNGKAKGTGAFTVLPELPISCPAQINGVPVACKPQAIASADFDLDGFYDLAVSMSTSDTSKSKTTTPGVVSVYTGRGDGVFDFATQIPVGTGLRGIVAADFTGDGVPDLAVADFSSNTVSILRAVGPSPRQIGDPCTSGSQCRIGFCVDQVCCSTDSCSVDQRCDISSNPGNCLPPATSGTSCTSAAQCQSASCVDSFCCSSASCPQGQFCNTGTCAPPSSVGTACSNNPQCASGNCVDGTCCNSADCPNGEFCNIPGSEGQCTVPAPLGTSCSVKTQCNSDFCVDGVCCAAPSCPQGQSCNLPGFLGQCTALPTQTPTATRTATATPTLAPQGNGFRCFRKADCTSTNCVDGVCCSAPSCPSGQTCNNSNFLGDCHLKGLNGEPCLLGSECASNACAGGHCVPPPTATPTATPTPLSGGDPCTSTSQCASGLGLVCNNEGVCCSTATCLSGQTCVAPGGGTCHTPLPTPTATPTPLSGGDPCTSTSRCASGLVCNSEGVCCQTDSCPPDQHCDILGAKGTCSDLLVENQPCEKSADCQSGRCLTNLVCGPPLPPGTPTATPTEKGGPVPSDTPGDLNAIQTVTRSGGCSIGERADAGGAWMLAALPVAFWARRFRRQHAHALRRERPRVQ